MRSKLFNEKPKTAKTKTEKWIGILPDTGNGYRLFDALSDIVLGRILVDAGNNWIYDGEKLTVDEQEEVAAAIIGPEKEMEQLLESIKEQ